MRLSVERCGEEDGEEVGEKEGKEGRPNERSSTFESRRDTAKKEADSRKGRLTQGGGHMHGTMGHRDQGVDKKGRKELAKPSVCCRFNQKHNPCHCRERLDLREFR